MIYPPSEIIEAAQKLTEWAAMHNIRNWKICGVQMRVDALEQQKPVALDDIKLPVDVVVGCGTIKAGCSLKTLLARIEVINQTWEPKLKLQNHSEQDLNMVQEPVACVLITYGREPECVTYDAIEELPEGEHNLYRAPPTAALAAKQMRDAAVKVFHAQAKAMNIDHYIAHGIAAEIAALPIPGEEK